MRLSIFQIQPIDLDGARPIARVNQEIALARDGPAVVGGQPALVRGVRQSDDDVFGGFCEVALSLRRIRAAIGRQASSGTSQGSNEVAACEGVERHSTDDCSDSV